MNHKNTVNMSGKVAIIGAGFVGSSIAYALMLRGLTREVVLIERPEAEGKCRAEINDIRHGIKGMGSFNIFSGNYADVVDCDLIIMTAGRGRRQGESRLEMTADNLGIAASVVNELKKYHIKGIVLVVSNPVDIITKAMTEWLGLPNGRVFGTGCLLDSSRLTGMIADYVGLSPDMVNIHVIGEHGDGQVVRWSRATIKGVPVREYGEIAGKLFTDGIVNEMEQKVRQMGAEIISGKGRTHYGIATCVCHIAEAMLGNQEIIASVSSVLNGEYEINGVAVSIPSVINADGIGRRLADELDEGELKRFREAAKTLDKLGYLIREGTK